MNGWIIGYIVGTGVVAVVALLLVLLTREAARVAAKAEAVLAALTDARDGTEGLWRLHATTSALSRLTTTAGAARESLPGGGRR